MPKPKLSRRQFIQAAAVAGGGTLLHPASVLADAYAPRAHRPVWGNPVRVRGRVGSGRRGIGGVAVTDGYNVQLTGADGSFELVTTDRQRFISISVPSGYQIPRLESGVASFFQPLAADRRGRMSANFDLQPLEHSDTAHAFLALGDTQTETAYEMGRLHDESVPDMIATVKALGEAPTFGLACGDIMFDDLSLYPEYERAVRRIDLPFFQVVGNHDLDFDAGVDPDSVRTFEKHFGPSYYSFNRGEVHYVVLDNVLWHAAGYIGHVGAEQLAWLERDLSVLERGQTVVVFQHIPSLSTQYRRSGQDRPGNSVSVTNREHLYQLLDPFNAHIISGHTHENEHVFEGGTHEHVLGTTCGAWWADDICHDGTPNGYAVYTANGSSLEWHYKGTGLEADEQIRVYPRGSDPAAPNEVVANVWDWDPQWSVVWLEDGMRRGEMARRVGRDPLAVARFDGGAKPVHRPWVQPVPVSHLFYAPVAENHGVVVEATDRFGRTYAAKL